MLGSSEEYITVADAAARKGVTESAIYQAIKDGRLPAVKMLNRKALRVSDVDALKLLPPNGKRRGVKLGSRSGKE